MAFNPQNVQQLEGSVLEVDLHLDTNAKLLIPGILKNIAFFLSNRINSIKIDKGTGFHVDAIIS